ncbi:pilus assembly protein TadG-related protein [Litoreibacter albidus]|uniref:pilus assembly protein TadG-related protein n=1 Tax=Litoreibacter albidus TaxID=670155 RepID=UPI0014799466|nr:pilus assembly protein TadG-related protein [Litoreibacter albidus]
MPINPLPRFLHTEDGAVAIIVSLLLTVLLGFVALGIDVAFLYRERAHLQSVSDLTAISAMAQPDNATQRADLVLSRNATHADAVDDMQMGRFLRNPEIDPEDRFIPLADGSPGINALRVVLQDDAALHFARIFTDDTHVELSRTAMATRTGAGSFSLDSHLVNLDLASLNQTLTQSFGVNASLTLGDINVLDTSDIDLGALLDALNAQSEDPSRNPAEILNQVTTAGDMIAALQSILPAGAASRLDGLAGAAGSTAFSVSDLVGGIDTDLGLTATDFLSEIDISALDVVKALVAAESAGQGLTLAADISVTGVISATNTLTMAEPPAQSGWIALGEEGVQLNRAAARLATEVTIEPSLVSNVLGGLGVNLQIAKVNLPIYTELAGSTATLTELGCNVTSPNGIAAEFSTAHTPLHPNNGTSVAALYLGELAAAGTGAIDPNNLDYADVIDLSVEISVPILGSLFPSIKLADVTVQAKSHVAVGTSMAETVSFTHAEVDAGATTKTFGSGSLLSSALSSLLSSENTDIRIKPGQEGLLPTSILNTLLQALPSGLANLAAPVDGLLDATLAGVGLELGAGELTLTGHHCEPIRLVN